MWLGRSARAGFGGWSCWVVLGGVVVGAATGGGATLSLYTIRIGGCDLSNGRIELVDWLMMACICVYIRTVGERRRGE